MYADVITESIRLALEETARRRKIQEEHNQKEGITPTPIFKSIEDQLIRSIDKEYKASNKKTDTKNSKSNLTKEEIKELIKEYRKKMKEAADELEFFKAAEYRDLMKELEEML